MEWSTDVLKNNNYVAEPVTFIVVPHRRYTLPFVSRNIYIEELVNDNTNENQENIYVESSRHDGVTFGEEKLLIGPQNEQRKDKLSQILNNVFQNLIRETKSGAFRRGRVLRRKLGLQRRSRSTGYLVRDRFHIFPACPCCKKIKKLKMDIASKPAVRKLQKIMKYRREKVKESLKAFSDNLNKNKDINDKGPEKLMKVDEDSLVDENPGELEITSNHDKCFLYKKFMELKQDVIKCYKDKKGNRIIQRKSSSSFYVDNHNRNDENLLRNEDIR